jgi:hypothetical protein
MAIINDPQSVLNAPTGIHSVNYNPITSSQPSASSSVLKVNEPVNKQQLTPKSIYRIGGDIFDAQTNQKIPNVTILQRDYAGAKEVNAPIQQNNQQAQPYSLASDTAKTPVGNVQQEQPVTQPITQPEPEASYNDILKTIGASLTAGYSTPEDIAANTGIDVNAVNNLISSDANLSQAYALKQQTNQDQKDLNEAQKKINDIQQGAFTLTIDEQAQIDRINKLFEEAKSKQIEANRMAEGSLAVGLSRFQEGGFTNTVGIMQDQITKNLNKVNQLDIEAANEVSKLKQLFKDNKYKEAKDSYDLVEKTLEKRKQSIKDIYSAVSKMNEDIAKQEELTYKRTQDEIANQFKFEEFDLKKLAAQLDIYKFDYQQKQDAFTNALSNDKFTWQQKQDLIKNEIDKQKFSYDQGKDAQDYALKLQQFQLDIQKASAADTPQSYREWQLAGGLNSGRTYDEFLLNKGKTADKPATADQQKNAGYALRMKEAANTIEMMTKQFKEKGFLSQQWQASVPSFLKSTEGQLMEQAQRDFVNAVLRRESGAAIADSEFKSATKQYFPQPGDSDAVINQKKKNRETTLKGIVNSSGTALDDTFKNSLQSYSYPDLETYSSLNPDKAQTILDAESALKDTIGRDPTDDEVLQFLQDDSDFNNVDGDTKPAILDKVSAKSDGSKGGQCGRFVNQLTGLGLGDSYQSKMAKMDSSITAPAPGMVFTMPFKNTGHTGIILAVNNDGTATVKDSNYSLDEKIKTHKIPISKMTGFRMV